MTTAGNVIFIALAIVVIAYDQMWKRLPPDHPAVRRQPGLRRAGVDTLQVVTEEP